MKEELKKIEVSLMQREEGSTEDFLSIGKQQLATITIQNLERKAETLYFSLQKRTADISKLADRSKMRSSLRKKINKDKDDLRNVVEEINSFSELCNIEKISVEDINEGIFPWLLTNTTPGNVPIRVKAAVVDKFVGIKRIKEEKVLLIQEMTNFMTYRDNILPKLREQDSQIRYAIDAILNPLEHEMEQELACATSSSKYEVKTSLIPLLKGKLSVTNGIWFAKLQMKKGVEHFRHCDDDEDFELVSELHKWNEELIENEYRYDESSSEEEESDAEGAANDDMFSQFDLSERLT